MDKGRQIARGRRVAMTFAAVTATCLWAVQVHPQDIVPGSAETGASLANRLCTSCHLTNETAGNAFPAGVPTMRGIANKPGQTGRHIAGVLMAPHSPMPNINLSREEIGHIIAYLQSLRTDKSLPPLLPGPTEGTPKPKLPAPA
jgi:cytochrome c